MPEHAVKGIPLLQTRNKWGFHQGSLRSVRVPYEGWRTAASYCQDTAQRRFSPQEMSGCGERSHVPHSRGPRQHVGAVLYGCHAPKTPQRARGAQPGCQFAAGMELPHQNFSFLF